MPSAIALALSVHLLSFGTFALGDHFEHLPIDDECSAGEGDCAVSELQVNAASVRPIKRALSEPLADVGMHPKFCMHVPKDVALEQCQGQKTCLCQGHCKHLDVDSRAFVVDCCGCSSSLEMDASMEQVNASTIRVGDHESNAVEGGLDVAASHYPAYCDHIFRYVPRMNWPPACHGVGGCICDHMFCYGYGIPHSTWRYNPRCCLCPGA